MNSRAATVFAVAAVGFLLSVPVGATFASVGPQTTYPHPYAFVWYFGYLGDTYEPMSDLALPQSALISEAASLSQAVGGKNNLVLIHAVAEGSQKYISTNMIGVEYAYVSALKQYAKYVSGWIDLSVINLTSYPHTVYTEVSKMVNDIGVNAIWFDHPVNYYSVIGRTEFNTMMATLHHEYPNVLFFLNVTDTKNRIKPVDSAKGMPPAWVSATYVLPSFARATGFVTETGVINNYNRLYGVGHVIQHFDSDSVAADEPMSKFADLAGSNETSLVSRLLQEGLNPDGKSNGFNLLIPIMGGNTYAKGVYQGKLYNSFSEGIDSRDTLSSLTSILSKYY